MANQLFPTRDIRNIGLGSGDPGAYANLNQDQSRVFGLAVMDLLRQYQKLGTKPFVQQQFNAQDQQVKRSIYTSPDLIGAAPGVQAGARNAAVGALRPTIQGAQDSQQTFGEQIKNFGTTIDRA